MVEYTLLKNRIRTLSRSAHNEKQLEPHQSLEFSNSLQMEADKFFNPDWLKRFKWLSVNTVNIGFYYFNCLTCDDSSQDPKWCTDGFAKFER